MEIQILLWIQEHLRTETLNEIVTVITSLGDAGFVWILIGAVLAMQKRYRTAGFLVWGALLFEWLLVDGVVKNIFMRERPFYADPALLPLIAPPKSFSFPSGHSGSSFAAAVVMWKLLPRKWGAPALVLAALIAVSRLYIGVHYPTDVFCGALVGTCCALLTVSRCRAKLRNTRTE